MSHLLPVIDSLKSANTSENLESLAKENTLLKITQMLLVRTFKYLNVNRKTPRSFLISCSKFNLNLTLYNVNILVDILALLLMNGENEKADLIYLLDRLIYIYYILTIQQEHFTLIKQYPKCGSSLCPLLKCC